MKRPISKKKADALVKHGAKITAPEPAQHPEPMPEPAEAKLSMDQVKEVMIAAMQIANKGQRRVGSRMVVNRDSRGFIETVDIMPLEDATTAIH